MFTDYQIVQIEEHGITLQSAQNQVELFKKGAPYLKLYRPATIGDGIMAFSTSELSDLANLFEKRVEYLSIAKFVPASGAATRMFKDLYEYLDDVETKTVSEKFFAKLSEFPFFELLLKQNNITTKDFDPAKLTHDQQILIVKQLLTEKGLNYGNLPKGLLLFHRYGNEECRTAFEEHLVEGAGYAACNKSVNLYLTVSPEHMMNFIVLFDEVKLNYEQRFGVKYKLSCSMQKAATDTIAVNTDNEPFEDEGQLIFRPGGHGALLENLNEILEDIIFIKNIDNVAPDALKPASYLYKKALAGLLLKTRDRVFEILRELEEGTPSHKRLQELTEEVCNKFQICYPEAEAENEDTLADFLWKMLYRPIRVCGMVRNAGEPGGGPFWAAGKEGQASLQIVETSQVDPKDEKQQQILKSTTHFNPVDLVCAVKDLHGRKFDLTKYRDTNAFFISRKSKNGRELKALELPGLWNGSMSDWITLFVEVPAITFNPVKTVFDLLRAEHQANSKQENLSNCDC
jgi:hypothetical protein